MSTQFKTKTSDWHSIATNALYELQQEVDKYPDPDGLSPPAALYAKVDAFLKLVSKETTQKIEVPDFSAGPNGEILLHWMCAQGSLDIVFTEAKVHGLLKARARAKASGTHGVVRLTEGFASVAHSA